MLNAGQVEELFKENLYLNVATEQSAQALRGRIVTHLAGAPEISGEAILMKGSDDSSVSGLAWASLDDTCRLHYSVRLEGRISRRLTPLWIWRITPFRTWTT